MNERETASHIVEWMGAYCRASHTSGFVVGVSGGVDSALVSALAAMTGLPVVCVTLPIHQPETHVQRADGHIGWLMSRYENVRRETIDLTPVFERFKEAVPSSDSPSLELVLANTRSRLRMTALYYVAGLHNLLVAGTGNKIEDFGIGFFTKYGDGGVDISPIGDLTKTEVYRLARFLGVNQDILSAKPTDGLFGDDRSDEDQIGATYPELEWAMEQFEAGKAESDFKGREKEVFRIFVFRNRANRHKTDPVPRPGRGRIK